GSTGAAFLVRAEEYGVPQARHRIFIIGVRRGLGARPGRLDGQSEVSSADVLADLPAVRSQLSREPDSPIAWQKAIQEIRQHAWYKSGPRGHFGDVVRIANEAFNSERWPATPG